MHVKARTLDGTSWSALNEAVFTLPSPLDGLRITEIMYHPPPRGETPDEAYEFVELKNAGDEIIDLTGIAFTDGIFFTFPDGATLE